MQSQTRQHLKTAALVFASIATAYLCYRVLKPFFPALIWAIALAIVAQPLHSWLVRRLRNRTLTALICVVVVTLALVIPIVLITEQVIAEATALIKNVSSPQFREQVTAKIAADPRIARVVDWVQQRVNVGEQVQALAGSAGGRVPAVFVGSLAGITQLIIALFTMFFLLRDSGYFLGAVRGFIPLPERDTDEVLSRVKHTIDASLRGRVLIAVIQGALGGLMFWWLDLSGALLWGAVMAIAALIPMLGAFIVWVPAALFLLATGSPGKAAILTLWGALVIGTADNVLYPILVGKDLRLHTITIFFAVLGGVAAFGAAGLVIGPVIFAVADALFDIWNRREPGTRRPEPQEVAEPRRVSEPRDVAA